MMNRSVEGKPLGVGGWGEAMFRGVKVAAKFLHEETSLGIDEYSSKCATSQPPAVYWSHNRL